MLEQPREENHSGLIEESLDENYRDRFFIFLNIFLTFLNSTHLMINNFFFLTRLRHH